VCEVGLRVADSLNHDIALSGLAYVAPFVLGVLVAFLLPSLSENWIRYALKGTVAGAIVPIVQSRNPFLIWASIFSINFFLGAVLRFVLVPVLLYHLSILFAIVVGFFVGFSAGSPTYILLFATLPTLGALYLILTFAFESLGYIVACAVGYRIGKESQKGLTRHEMLRLLIFPYHLKRPERRLATKKSLKANIPWIMLSMTFIIIGASTETLLIVLMPIR